MAVVDPMLYWFPQLEHVPLTSLRTKLTVMTGSWLFFFFLFLAGFVVSYLFVPSFTKRLRTKEKVFWCLAFVRAVFGFVASVSALWFLFVDDILTNDIVDGRNVTTFISVYLTAGYFLFEFLALSFSNVYFRFFEPFLFVHHFLSVIGFSVALCCDGKGHFFAVVGLLLEMTTPFSCFCWMLLKCDMAKLRIWKLNQLVLVHLFHTRTTLEGYIYYKYYQQWDNVREGMPIAISVMVLSQVTLNFFLLTPYWTYKKMMQLFNPVDWNHPETIKSSATNGSANGQISSRTKSKSRNRRKKID